MKKRIAIIGASAGQLSLCRQAKEMGIETFCFAWSQDAVCKEVVDYFIPVSIFEMDKIVAYCRKYEVDGVVTNASERTALVASYVAEKLKLPCTPFKAFLNIQNKEYVRCKTNMMEGLGSVKVHIGTAKELMQSVPKPYVLKPVNGSAKRGVNFVSDSVENVIIPDDMKNDVFMAEQYIEGKEYSVESISYDGQHDVIQITEKISTSAPHFVELEHHQPAALSCELRNKIHDIIPKILTKVCFMNGASHTEIKIDNRGEVYLIEINPRGGGDFISNDLVSLSTDFNYLKNIILVALGIYKSVPVNNVAYAGVYFLSAYASRLLPYFEMPKQEWMIRRERYHSDLTMSCSNYDRDGYIIYKSDKKIML